jgi:hypothetical protein
MGTSFLVLTLSLVALAGGSEADKDSQSVFVAGGQEIKGQASPALPQNTQKAPTGKRWGKFTIGKATTYVTGPLDSDGAIDYPAVLNNHLRGGVTAENNANVLLWRMLGPDCDSAIRPSQFFPALGMQPPAKDGEYFIGIDRFVKEHLRIDPSANRDVSSIEDQIENAKQRPWRAGEYPKLASWLNANEKPLALVMEATRRPHYYVPLLPAQTDGKRASLITAMLPGVQPCRQLADALVARAMLRTAQGDEPGAWQDLLACHRLGRLIARGGTLIQTLVGVAIDGMAHDGDLAFLRRTEPTSPRAGELLGDLRNLPSWRGLAEDLHSERFMFLDHIMMLHRDGFRYFQKMSGQVVIIGDDEAETQIGNRILEGLDWDPALRNANGWFDRLTSALGEKERSSRETKLKQFETDLKALAGRREEMAGMLRDETRSAQARGEAIGNIVIALLIPAVVKVQHVVDRAVQLENNRYIAFALAQYQRDEGYYPETLNALKPKYLSEIPPDIFSGQPLIYVPRRHIYQLYSVGINGQDEDGRGTRDEPPGDDLAVFMAAPGWSQSTILAWCAGFVMVGTLIMVVRDRWRRDG